MKTEVNEMLSPEEKAKNRFDRMLATAKQYRVGTFKNKVAGIFQRMIRAEAAADKSLYAVCVINGKIAEQHRKFGQCVCVTCGSVQPWSGDGFGGMHTGHFLAGRFNSILFDEANVAPQCSSCNVYGSGRQNEYRMWMELVRPDDIERLEALKRTPVSITREELVEKKIQYTDRIKATGL